MDVRRNRKIPVIIVLLAIAAIVLISIFTKEDPAAEPTNELADLAQVYASDDGTVPIYANGELSSVKGIVYERHIYLKLGVVLQDINDGFFWDDTEKCLSYASANEITRVREGDTFDGAVIFFDSSDTDAKKSEDAADRICISLNYVAQFANMEVNIYNDPGRVFLSSKFGELDYAVIPAGTAVRLGATEAEEILIHTEKTEDAWLISQDGDYSKVFLSGPGHVGYVPSKDIDSVKKVSKKEPYREEPYTRRQLNEPVCMVWHQVFNESGIDEIEGFLDRATGINVLSPTWFSVASSDGSIESRADGDYVRIAHERGIQVWALVENFNVSTKLDYGRLFGRTTNRTRLVNNLIKETQSCGADGINLDFEGLPSDAGSGYLQFIKELAVACHDNGLFFSIDNYVPSAWTQHYHREAQAKIADYFIVMAYDEHYAGSDAGSTASLPFIKNGIENTVNAGVPIEMIVVGMPFYSRIWRGEDAAVSSETLNMSAMEEAKDTYRDFMVWDEECGQNYIEAEVEGELNRIWVEDEDSLKAKLNLILGYDVAGVSCWKLGMETPGAWSVIAAKMEEQ